MPSSTIHSTAIVDPKAELGADVFVGPYCLIEAGVRVGAKTRLTAQVHLRTGAILGESCHVHTGAVIGDSPQVIVGAPKNSFVKIGDRCILREFATVHRSMNEGGATTIGNDCFLMVNSHVAHDCVLGNKVVLVNGALLAGHAHIEEGVIISGNSVVHQFCRIGRLAFLSGIAGISKDVPPFMLADGRRAVVRGLNSVGLRRSGLSVAVRQEIKRAYKILYQSDLNVSQALQELDKLSATPEVKLIADFIRASKRGILSGASNSDQPTDE